MWWQTQIITTDFNTTYYLFWKLELYIQWKKEHLYYSIYENTVSLHRAYIHMLNKIPANEKIIFSIKSVTRFHNTKILLLQILYPASKYLPLVGNIYKILITLCIYLYYGNSKLTIYTNVLTNQWWSINKAEINYYTSAKIYIIYTNIYIHILLKITTTVFRK